MNLQDDQELQSWLDSLREVNPTDIEMAQWKKAIRAEVAKKSPAPRPFWLKLTLELTKVAIAASVGFVVSSYYFYLKNEEGQKAFYQAEEEAPLKGGALSQVLVLDEKPPVMSVRNAKLTDKKGKTWASGFGFDSEFVSISTPEGTVLLSYVPFAGARELGHARGKLIEFKLPGLELAMELQSESEILSAGLNYTVYGLYLASRKTSQRGTFQIYEAATADRVLARARVR